MGDAGAMYPTVDYAYTCVPSYPSGQIGFILARKAGGATGSLRAPARSVPADLLAALKYYSPEMHAASFVLPRFASAKLDSVRTGGVSGVFSKLAGAFSDPLLAVSVLSVGAALGWGACHVFFRRA